MKARNFILAIVGIIVLTGSVWGQHNHQTAPPASTATKQAPTEEMMNACHHHMTAAKDTLAKLDVAVTDAQKADTDAKKQAALEEVRELTDQLKHHISMCPMMQSESMESMEGMNCMKDKAEKAHTKN